MADRLTMAIEHARINHKRVLCGPGVPGCGSDCEGGPDGEPAEFCPTCGVWPCSTSVLLGEVDRLTAGIDEAIEAGHDAGYAGMTETLRALRPAGSAATP